MSTHRAPTLACLLCAALPAQRPSRTPPEHEFHLDHVLGTSLDATFVTGERAEAEAMLAAARVEIDRLARILSGHDEGSELRRLVADGGSAAASVELREVLAGCARWNALSGGAFDVRVGTVLDVWRAAQKAGRPPDQAELADALARMRASGWRIDERSGAIELAGRPRLATDSFAKSFVLARALAAARERAPAVEAGMLAIGGDIVTFGTPRTIPKWRIAITDPRHPADNAPPLATLAVGAAALATSAGYARGFDIAGKHWSHIVDPRTGMPAQAVGSATVVARDAVTAGPLATTLCVLSPEAGLALVARTPGADCLIVAADGTRHASPGLAALLEPAAARPGVDAKDAPAAASGWADGGEMRVRLVLPEAKGRGYRRPYVAVWVEDGGQRLVRTLAIWGNERRWLREMSHWTEAAGWDGGSVHATTRATRAPGEYTLAWDGRDDAGKPVAAGEYVVCVEVAREHGGHTIARRSVVCGGDATVKPLQKNGELAGGEAGYWPRAAGR